MNYRHTSPAATLAEHGRRAILLVGALMLSACGGGGGGGGTIAPSGTPVVTFTSWSAVQPGTAVEVKGLGMQVTYDRANNQISSPNDPSAANVLFRFDSSGKLTDLFPTSSVSFSGSDMTLLAADEDFVIAGNTTNVAAVSNPRVSDPSARAWEYQSFGFWEADLDPNSRTFGVFSVGDPTTTPVLTIPGVDGATFTGKVVGSYVSADGLGHTVLANLSVTANFSSPDPSLTLSTTTTLISAQWGSFEPSTLDPATLDLIGTLTLTGNTFSGDLKTKTASGLTGNSTGQFYGPNATELGGVFILRDPTSLETYSGAYGASRPLP